MHIIKRQQDLNSSIVFQVTLVKTVRQARMGALVTLAIPVTLATLATRETLVTLAILVTPATLAIPEILETLATLVRFHSRLPA